MPRRTLGPAQRSCLESLVRHAGWPGGWLWQNRSSTIRVLDSLVRRGFAMRTTKPGRSPHIELVIYKPTKLGIERIKGKKRP